MPWRSYRTKDITERYLFKFLPLNRLESFLSEGEIWFSRADQFGDKMECVRIADISGQSLDYKKIEERKRRYLISCWHLANKESLAFWDTYSESIETRKNIAIRFDRKELINALNYYFYRNDRFYYQTQWIHGRVQYKDMINAKSDTLNKSKIKFPAFRKEKAFNYENEYRLTIERVDEHIEKGFGYYIGEPNRLNFDILINPLLMTDDFNALSKRIEELGFGDKIKESILSKWLRPDKWGKLENDSKGSI